MANSEKPSESPIGRSKKTPKPQVEPFDWKNLCAPHPVIGVDEVGRGCLAGPVYAAAVILPEDCPYVSGLTDSKLLSETRREELSGLLWESARVGVGIASVEEIDAINILQAARLAMARAVRELQLNEGHILVDGRDPVPGGFESWPQTTLIKGDLRAAPVAAASIVAKVARDQWMKELALKEPGYGFEVHKGYGTPAHRKAIQERGPSRFHRRTFAGVREHWHRLEVCTAPGSLV